MEDRGVKINRKKTVYPRFNGDLQWENWERVNTFKYLGAILAENRDLDEEMTTGHSSVHDPGQDPHKDNDDA